MSAPVGGEGVEVKQSVLNSLSLPKKQPKLAYGIMANISSGSVGCEKIVNKGIEVEESEEKAEEKDKTKIEEIGEVIVHSERKKMGRMILCNHGVILFKNCLSIEEQKDLVNCCLQMSKEGGNSELLSKGKEIEARRGGKYPIPLLFYNWPARPRSINSMKEPLGLLQYGRDTFKRAFKVVSKEHYHLKEHQLDNPMNFQCPESYSPNALYAVLYPPGGNFAAHLDGANGWVLAVSIGDTATFFYSLTLQGKRTYLVVESGDAIIFNGGQLHHGIEKIFPGTAPEFWRDPENEISKYEMSRLNLQFRDPAKDWLGYDPYFYDHTGLGDTAPKV